MKSEGVTLSWLQFVLGAVSLVGTIFWSWHSVTTKLEVVTAVQTEQLQTLRGAVTEQQKVLFAVHERVVRIEERGKR
jgi:hypothetical protein